MSSTLLVPIPEADHAIAPFRPAWEPPPARGVPAHVSILFPFLRRRALNAHALSRIAEAAAAVEPFTVRFRRTGRFDRTVFLVPEPARPFAELTRLIVERFPDCPPYRGAHGSVLNPHLTVLTCADGPGLDEAELEIRRSLPLRAAVRELWLMVEDQHGGWRLQHAFPLGRND